MRKIVAYGIVTSIIISMLMLAAPITVSAAPTQATEFNIGVIFATGGLGDQSFNDAAYRGMQDSITKYASNASIDLNFVYREPASIPEFETYQNELALNGSYDLIICVGFLQTSALNQTARTYPSQNFVLIDDVLELDNVQCITFKEHEGSFLVGAMAAMTTNTSKLGFLGGLDIYLINKFKVGYEQGAKYIDDSITVDVKYSPNPDNPWGDLAGGKTVAETMYGTGIDIVYSAAGGTGLGVFEAANETANAMAIGVDSDQDHLAKGKVLCSMIKKVETAVSAPTDEIIEGTFTSGHSEYGLAEDGVDISAMTYTPVAKNRMVMFDGVNQTAWQHIQDIKADIIAGDIVVDTPDTESTSAPGFEFMLIFALIPVALISKRKRK